MQTVQTKWSTKMLLQHLPQLPTKSFPFLQLVPKKKKHNTSGENRHGFRKIKIPHFQRFFFKKTETTMRISIFKRNLVAALDEFA
jgi:hypothetical protein